jgi:hypothetical protein
MLFWRKDFEDGKCPTRRPISEYIIYLFIFTYTSMNGATIKYLQLREHVKY